MFMNTSLTEGFSALSDEKWIELLNKELKGKDYRDSLIWNTREGIVLEPFYSKQSSSSTNRSSFRRSSASGNGQWEIDQEISVGSEVKLANQLALEALNSGASSITFCGEIASESDFRSLISGIGIQFIEIRFRKNSNPAEILSWLIAAFNETGAAPSALRGAVENDSISSFLTEGNFSDTEIQQTIRNSKGRKAGFGRLRSVTVNAALYHNSGANTVEELAFALAHGHEYLNGLVNSGMNIDEAASHLEFRMAASTDFYFSLAKFRAFRELWSKVVAVYKPEHNCSHHTFLIGETSDLFAAHIDPYTNLLRYTSEAFAGISGGCDAFSVRSFNGEESAFSLRMGRNIQLLLREEAHLDKTSDPSGGSYFLEYLTDELIQRAWELFRSIEKDGGILSWMKNGEIVNRVERSADQLRSAFRDKKMKMIGVNIYPDKNETTADFGNSSGSSKANTIPVLSTFRISETELQTSH
jgi:methylmalonyl-CoA mutase